MRRAIEILKVNKKLLFLALVCGILYLYHLGSYALWDTDETLYTRIAKEMYLSGDYITPQWNFTPWFCHPPFYFWMVNLFSKILGWSEFSARFPSALFGMLNVFLVYYWGKLLFDEEVGFLAGLIFATSLQMWIQSRMAILDMPFLFFISLSVYSYMRGILNKNRWWFYGFWVSSALAVLSKGPVGFVLPLGYVSIERFCAFLRRKEDPYKHDFKRFLKEFFNLPPILLFFIISSFWYATMIDIYGRAFYTQVFGYFFINRIIEPVMDQGGPIYYYVLVLIGGMFPWTFLIPATISYSYNNKDKYIVLFLLLWVTVTFVGFSIADTKLPNYILFLYPPLVLLMGKTVKHLSTSKDKKYVKFSLISYPLFLIVVFLGLAYGFMYKFPHLVHKYGRIVIPISVYILVSAVVILISATRDYKKGFYYVLATICGFYFMLVSYAPFIDNIRPELKVAKTITQNAQKNDIIIFRKRFGPINSVIYYTNLTGTEYPNTKAMLKAAKHKNHSFMLMYKWEYDKFKKEIPPLWKTIWKDEKNLVLLYKE